MKNFSKRIYIIVAVLTLSLAFIDTALAQTTPKEGKKVTEIEYEKKKDFSKLRAEQKWDEEEMFTKNDIPEAWQDESIILLAFKMKVKADLEGPNPVQNYYIHTRFKLNDMAAVEAFSDYDFDDGDLVEIKVVKPDGKIKKVNLDEAVSEETELKMDRFNIPLTGKKKKIAIKDLEIGDIVDYSSLFRTFYVSSSNNIFLMSSFPTVAYKYEFLVNTKCYAFAFKNMNSCPEYIQTSRNGYKVFTIESSMIEKEKEEMLAKGVFDQPYFKFHLLYTRNFNKVSYYPFYISRKETKTSITEEDLKYLVNNLMKETSGYGYALERYNKKNKVNKRTKFNRSYFENYYYYLRENFYLGELAFKDKYSEKYLVFPEFIKLAKSKKMPYEVILAVPKNIGTFENILFGNEIYKGVRINFPGEEPLYVFEFGPFSHSNQYHHTIEGTEIYVFKNPESLKKVIVSKETLPVSSAEQNKYNLQIAASLNNFDDTLLLAQKTTISGYFKYGSNMTKGLNYFEYYLKYKELKTEDGSITLKKPHYFFPYQGVYKDPKLKLIESEEQRIEKEHKERQEELVKERMKSAAEEEFQVHDYESFKLLNDGRAADKKDIEWEEQFKIGGILDKAGDSYVLHLGKIFGSLADISSSLDRKDRTLPFYIDFNRTYAISLKLTLPAGVKVSGLSAVNKKVDNSVGVFIVEAQQNGNVIEVKMSKTYKAFKHEAEEWEQYIEFSDAGADFINKKIILSR